MNKKCNDDNYCEIHDLEYFHRLASEVLDLNDQCTLVLDEATTLLNLAIIKYQQGMMLHDNANNLIPALYNWLDKCSSKYPCNVFSKTCSDIGEEVGSLGEKILSDESSNLNAANELLQQWLDTNDEIDEFHNYLNKYIDCVHSKNSNNNCSCNQNKKLSK